jgi:putative membrane protein
VPVSVTPSEATEVLGRQPRRLNPLSPVAGLVFSARELFGLAVVALSIGAWVLLPIGLVVVLGLRYWSWWRFTFELEDGARGDGAPEDGGPAQGPVLRVDSGILQRNVRRIPLDRVQRVEVLRKVRHRLLGLAVLRIDTAGGTSGGEVDLDALSTREAAVLRQQLDQGRRGLVPAAVGPVDPVDPDHAPGPSTPNQPVVALSTARLAVAGITGAQLFVMLAVAAWVLQLLDDLPGASVSVEDTVAETEVPRTVLSIGLGVGAVAVLWIGLAALAAIVTYHGFSVVRKGGDLHVRRGLLDVRETVVPLRRVQAVRIEQNLLRRPIGLASVRIATAGDPGRESGHVVVPALRPEEVDALLRIVLPGTSPLPSLAPAPPAARRRAVLRRVGTVALVGVPLAAWVRTPVVASVVLAGLGLAVLVGLDAYRGLGLARAERTVVTRVGALVRTTWIVPDARTQSVRVRSSFFQRRQALATLHLDVAGQREAPRVVDREDGRCRSLAVDVLATTVPA